MEMYVFIHSVKDFFFFNNACSSSPGKVTKNKIFKNELSPQFCNIYEFLGTGMSM